MRRLTGFLVRHRLCLQMQQSLTISQVVRSDNLRILYHPDPHSFPDGPEFTVHVSSDEEVITVRKEPHVKMRDHITLAVEIECSDSRRLRVFGVVPNVILSNGGYKCSYNAGSREIIDI